MVQAKPIDVELVETSKILQTPIQKLMETDKQKQSEFLSNTEFSMKDIIEFADIAANNAWYGKSPSTLHFKNNQHVIKITGYTYEPHYESFSATVGISLDEEKLFYENDVSVESYCHEVRQYGRFHNSCDAIQFLKENFSDQKFSAYE